MGKKYLCVIILFVGLCHGVSKASECIERGRFPNNETNDCRGYTMCLLGGLTNFTQYKLVCPMGSVYSHLEEQCTNATNYKCHPAYNCTSVGNFAIPGSNNCTSFAACVEGLSGMVTARLIDCPLNTQFNSTAGVCVNSTEFTCEISKTDLNHNTENPVYIARPTFNNPTNNAVKMFVNLSLLVFVFLIIPML